MKKIIASVMIIIGLGLILYPKASEHYYDYKRKTILKELENSQLEENKDNKKQNNYEIKINKTNKGNNNLNINKNSDHDNEIYAILTIDKINFKQPILNNPTKENLKISVASINIDVKPGGIGNYSIAGHRSHTYGRNFNRLNELNLKDKIKVSYNKNDYTYIITNKFVAKPDKTEVLNSNKSDKEITLITCDPMINPTNRLIIKGKLIQ